MDLYDGTCNICRTNPIVQGESSYFAFVCPGYATYKTFMCADCERKVMRFIFDLGHSAKGADTNGGSQDAGVAAN